MVDNQLPAGFQIDDTSPVGSTGGLPTGFKLEQDIYGSPTEQIKAGAEALVRGASLGTSDVLEQGLGVPAENIAARKRSNPITAFAGEAAGSVLPIMATEGAAAPLALGKIGTGALVGGVLGSGNIISDVALGDPDLNAQKILIDLGGGIVGGAAFGALEKGIAAIPALWRGAKTAAPKTIESVLEKPVMSTAQAELTPREALTETGLLNSQPQTEVEQAAQFAAPGMPEDTSLRRSVDFNNLDKDSQETFLNSITKKKSNADEIISAAQALKAPVPEGLISDSEHIQKIEDMLRTSPTILGVKRAALYDSGYNIANDVVSKALGGLEEISPAEAGNKLKEVVYKYFEDKSGPISQLYKEIEQDSPMIPISDKSTGSISKNINNIIEEQGLIKGTPEHSFVSTFADGIDQVDNLQKLKQFRTALGRSTGPETRFVASEIKEKLDNLEQNAIKRYAGTIQDPEAKQSILGLLDKIDLAKSGYAQLRQEMGTVGKNVLGRNKIYGPQDFLDAVDAQVPEKFAKKLFTKDNSEFAQWLNENIPEASNLLSQYKRSEIRELASPGEKFNPIKAIKEVNKLSPEIKNVLFKPEEIGSLDNAKTYLDAFPKNFNPSGTSSMQAYRSFFEHPISAITKNLADLGAAGLVKSSSGEGQSLVSKVINLLSTMSKRTDETIKDLSESIWTNRAIKSGAIAGTIKLSDSVFNDHVKNITSLSNNPQTLINHLAGSTANLSQVAPNIAQSVQNTISRGVQFLSTKLPPKKSPLALSEDYEPSAAEKAKFSQYYNAVDNPLIALQQAKRAQLTPETMEAIQAVHPHLLDEMRKQVMANYKPEMAKNLSHAQKSALSQFLGASLNENITPATTMQNQTLFAAPNRSQQSAPKPTLSGMKKLNSSGRIKTKTEEENE